MTQVEFHGADGISNDTLLAILPRPAPATYTDDEIDEYQRRITNLGIFDRVDVRFASQVLVVELRKKFTISPRISLSTGRTLADTYLLLGADEYNAFGQAKKIWGYASYAERAPSARVSYSDHPYDPHQLAPFVALYYQTSELRFPSKVSWLRRRVGGLTGFTLPYAYSSPLRIEIGVQVHGESYADVEGPVHLRPSVYVGQWLEAAWDRYKFHDLVPAGFRITFRGQLGARIGPAEKGHYALLQYVQAIGLSPTTVIMIQATGEVYNRGDPNWSASVGSVTGVRGLSDAYYRDHLQGVANIEFRQAWRFAERWALQGVLFADGAQFRSMDEYGRLSDWVGAFSAGVGARLIPTFLAGLVLRVDSAWLRAPESTWLLQTGLSQYF
ncbi:hypothetical protein [Pendulispora albinea]|uniref:Bacterial surface antigen (D15) domain-containing protein n=1 Tax=Pendulispora albinea TaxID=2741071 RepID=A0ABZ2M269_9BACT